jgi:hypothetical protein
VSAKGRFRFIVSCQIISRDLFGEIFCALSSFVFLRYVKGLAVLLAWKIKLPFVSRKISANHGTSEVNQVLHLKERSLERPESATGTRSGATAAPVLKGLACVGCGLDYQNDSMPTRHL